MANLRLDILVVPTFNINTLNVLDASVYPNGFSIVNPTIEITPPGFNTVVIEFNTNTFNIFTTSNLGITDEDTIQPLPDGIYQLKYSVTPAYDNFVEKTIMRVDKLQEKFDAAFMKLDMMECDFKLKRQSKIDLTTIYFFIQGAIAAANNCAIVDANKLYKKADNLLNIFNKNNCNC